jgi:hypothetical protein
VRRRDSTCWCVSSGTRALVRDGRCAWWWTRASTRAAWDTTRPWPCSGRATSASTSISVSSIGGVDRQPRIGSRDALKRAGRASCQGARPRCWLRPPGRLADGDSVVHLSARPGSVAAGDLQQGRNLQSDPPGPRAVGGQQAPTLGAQFLCTPVGGGATVPVLRMPLARGESAMRRKREGGRLA